MLIGRLNSVGPWVVSAAGAMVAALADLNLGTLATGITGLSLAIGGAYWMIARKRIKIFEASEAAKLKVYKDSKKAELQVFEASEAAKLKVIRQARADELKLLRAASVAKIKIQADEDAANKESLSARLVQLQQALEEANSTVKETRGVADFLSTQLKELTSYSHQAKHEAKNDAQTLLNGLELQKREIQVELDKLQAGQRAAQETVARNKSDIAALKANPDHQTERPKA